MGEGRVMVRERKEWEGSDINIYIEGVDSDVTDTCKGGREGEKRMMDTSKRSACFRIRF